MYWDVTNLDTFYQSPLGKRAQKSITLCFESLLQSSPISTSPSLNICLGYTYPFLKTFKQESLYCTVMPPKQGSCRVSLLKPFSLSQVVAEEHLLPFEDKSNDLLIMVHWLEGTQDPILALREAWRILKDTGEIILLVANRRSLWAAHDHTPFGIGSPFSYTQLIQLLEESFFLPTHLEGVLYFPPFSSKVFLPTIPLFEKIGTYFKPYTDPFWAGGWVIKATKLLYAPIQSPQKKIKVLKSFLPVPDQRLRKESRTTA